MSAAEEWYSRLRASSLDNLQLALQAAITAQIQGVADSPAKNTGVCREDRIHAYAEEIERRCEAAQEQEHDAKRD